MSLTEVGVGPPDHSIQPPLQTRMRSIDQAADTELDLPKQLS